MKHIFKKIKKQRPLYVVDMHRHVDTGQKIALFEFKYLLNSFKYLNKIND